MGANFERLIADKARAVFGPETRIASIRPLAGDASSRRYYRAALTPRAGLPSTVIAMGLPSGSHLPLSSEELAVFAESPKELPFLNVHRFLKRIGVRVPELYGEWQGEGILMLEDLGDIALWDRVQGKPDAEILAWYQKAIDELLILQVRGTEQRDDVCYAFKQRFDFRLYLWEFEHFLEWGWEKRPRARPPKRATEALRKAFTQLARRLDGVPSCLNHRDYHSWNIMVNDGQIAVIDFQDALLAPPQYDLASLLNDRVTDSIIRPHLEEQLLRYYLDQRAEVKKSAENLDEFLEVYLLSTIQRDLKVVGRFYFLDVVKGKPGYRQFIPSTLRRLKRNLARLPQTKNLIAILAEEFEEMR